MRFMPIISKGEKLAEEAQRFRRGGEKQYPYTYEEARERAINDINNVTREFEKNKELYLENEVIINVRMNEKFLAKSYIPDLFNKKESMKFVGARIYDRKTIGNKEVKSKLYFVKCSKENLDWLLTDLLKNNFTETQMKQLRSIDSIDVLTPEEKTLGFIEGEDMNRVEVVLHPIKEDKEKAIGKLKQYMEDDMIIREYEDGPIFISGKVKKENILIIAKYNFLRTIHPLREISLPDFREVDGGNMPRLPKEVEVKSKIKIGVFDGGANESNQYLAPFIRVHDLASLPANEKNLKHGNAVCGAVLYGEMNQYKSDAQLSTPICEVESFRVLPEKDIYFAIDNIERIVNSRNDIDIYNISFGPRGPILDDQIDRFTYALDKLALKNKIFCIAVGNDGEVIEPFNRIQVPSDAVNCIGVGAYSSYLGDIYRAGYSCIGAGREGAKIKPDLLAFGGDERNYFQAIDFEGKNRMFTAGTSFASPIVARKIGELMNVSSELNPLMARTLLIHSAEKKLNNAAEEGFGIVKDNIEDIIQCNERKVTIIYEGYLIPSRAMKLPIPLPDIKGSKGNVKFNWTICTLTDVSTLDGDLYTNTCIEETFYPNAYRYSFSKIGKKSVDVDIMKDIELAKLLECEGFKASKNPIGDTATRRSEHERRLDYKWDTISSKSKGKNIDGVNDPFLIISAISRDDGNVNKVKFCVAVTIEAKKYDGNMYEDILNKYEVLTPINVNVQVEQAIEEQVN